MMLFNNICNLSNCFKTLVLLVLLDQKSKNQKDSFDQHRELNKQQILTLKNLNPKIEARGVKLSSTHSLFLYFSG